MPTGAEETHNLVLEGGKHLHYEPCTPTELVCKPRGSSKGTNKWEQASPSSLLVRECTAVMVRRVSPSLVTHETSVLIVGRVDGYVTYFK